MVIGRKKAICFFVIFLFVNISGLAKNEKSQDKKFENYVVLENENNKDLSGGGLLSVVCKLIEIAKNEEKEGYIKDACFRNYEDLKNILMEKMI